MTAKWSGPSGVIAPPIEGPITYELMAEDKSRSSRGSSAVRQTSLASAPARGWRYWWRCDDPTLPAAWSGSAASFTATAGSQTRSTRTRACQHGSDYALDQVGRLEERSDYPAAQHGADDHELPVPAV